jgi:hypothetical protein
MKPPDLDEEETGRKTNKTLGRALLAERKQ